MSSNDLGDEIWLYEEKLQTIFKVAQSWKAVLLIDEADIFLSKRTLGGDYYRNHFTSLFLRVLEYFEGIMFLTTNLSIEIDDAIESRVQLLVPFYSLNESDRAKIWKRQMKDARIPPDWDLAEKCDVFGRRYNLNGRDIRNLVQVSRKICQQKDQPLSEELIDDVFELRYRRKGDIRNSFKRLAV